MRKSKLSLRSFKETFYSIAFGKGRSVKSSARKLTVKKSTFKDSRILNVAVIK